jgi:hypothetical protein
VNRNIVPAAVLTVGFMLTSLSLAQPPRADAELAAWVSKRVADWQPTREERRFDDIAWAGSLTEALRLARLYQRPVFLFTHDGRMAIGRC